MKSSSQLDFLIEDFLSGTEWETAKIEFLAGDASNRSYKRLSLDGSNKTAVLMIAPSDKGENVRPFLFVADLLQNADLSAPEIILSDPENGLLLIEDLGDALFAKKMTSDPSLEMPLYETAVDVLTAVHRIPAPKQLPDYSTTLLVELATLSIDWYRFGVRGTKNAKSRADFQTEMSSALDQIAPFKPTIALRDYHAENLIWLPDRTGPRRVGLLDFQDAMTCHPAYDLVSLLEDARRDVPAEIQARMKQKYVRDSGANEADFEYAYSVIGAQRNLRIIGVFARLSLHFGKPHYVDLIPRVWAHLNRDLSHPKLAGLRRIVLKELPEPTDAVLRILKSKCATIPTLS